MIMAHAQPDLIIKVVQENNGLLNQDNNNIMKKKRQQKKNDNGLSSRADGAFKFNVQAQEFVPKSMPPVPPCQYGKGTGGTEIVSDKDAKFVNPTFQCTKNNDVLTEQLQNKIIKQIEYQFTNMSLLANEKLEKQIQNDTEGFVPISLVTSTKKLKPIFTSNQNLVVEALHASTKLDVSSDGTRVRRKNPFTQEEKEELQSRTIIAENLPDDHSHQNLEKIFYVAGVAKAIRVCNPQEASSRANRDCVISTKLHALVEFESIESAEKTVEKLNDDMKSQKSSLRVRMLIRPSPKSVLKNGKSVFEKYIDDEEEVHQVKAGVEDNSRVQHNNPKTFVVDTNAENHATSSKKVKQTTKIPRMPDGTKGFNVGRGRQITVSA